MIPDSDLAARAAGGDQDAFRTLVERHSRSLFGVAYRMSLNEHDAEDIVQECFLRAWKQIRRFDGRANFSTWLYRIAANYAIDLMRSRKRVVVDEELASSGRDTSPTPERGALSGELGERIRHAMDGLSTSERAAFVMRHMEGLAIDEIARALDCNENAAKHSVFRAVHKLRDSLRGLGLQPVREEV